MLQTKIAGIPCQVKVLQCTTVSPDYSTRDSDIDYYGYSEIDYEVCDRRGRRADWLARKMTKADEARIEQEIVDSMRD